jgi:hypothetical protein
MSIQDYAQLFGTNLVRHSPVLFLGIAGLWRSVIRREQLAQAYTTASWAFAMLAAHAIFSVVRDVARVAVRTNADAAGQLPGEIGITLTAVAAPAYVALLAALVLLGRAVLFGRASNGDPGVNRTSGSEVVA